MLNLLRWWFSQFTLYGGGKGGSAPAAPPAPDYRGAAMEQAAASKEAQTAATWANRPTLNTPWGQQTWEAAAGVDPSTGLPITNWTSNINLTPEQQQALDAQQRIQAGRSGAAEELLGQATDAFRKPFDWESAPEVGTLDERQQGAFGKMAAMLQPGRQQQEAALDTKLANMGLPRNSEAWNRAKSQLQESFAQQDKGLLAQSLQEGRADVGTMGQLRQQALSEEAMRRGMTLNELNALLTGQQVANPAMPSFSQAQASQAPNLLGAAQSQGQYNMGAANLASQNASQGGFDWGSAIGGVASVAGIAL